MNAEQIEDIIKQDGVKVLLLQFSDLTGRTKVVEIESHRFRDIIDFGAWYDGSSVEGHARICESDMLLRPDLATFAVMPWTNTEFKSARLICDIYLPDGSPFAGDPRFILKKTLAEIAALGYGYYTAAELEFFLFERSELPRLIP
ncbi:MAG: glutamine synthetase beta-grasp domain-containing protein, partial [bacterium]